MLQVAAEEPDHRNLVRLDPLRDLLGLVDQGVGGVGGGRVAGEAAGVGQEVHGAQYRLHGKQVGGRGMPAPVLEQQVALVRGAEGAIDPPLPVPAGAGRLGAVHEGAEEGGEPLVPVEQVCHHRTVRGGRDLDAGDPVETGQGAAGLSDTVPEHVRAGRPAVAWTGMGEEVRADPVEIARVAQSYLDNSTELASALRAVRADAVLSPADFGQVNPAGQLNDAYQTVTGGAGTAVERVIGVLEVDNESLLQVAFAYRQADERAAERHRRDHRNIPI
ncbi:hypothetical protein ACN27G_35190 [Plantactinospora sp. WMMB334]|uniref:hypothetical protein n=1 Tax=Plantactinospora sp. WMMB334 TaxID=3404119 RepID=UPI003B95D549